MDGSAEGRFSIRAVCEEGSSSSQALSEIAAFVLRVSPGDTNPPPRPPAPLLRCHGGGRHPAGGPSHRLGRLTLTPPAIIMVVAIVSFGLAPTAATPKEPLAATQP